MFGKRMKILTEFSGKNNHSLTGIFSPKNSGKRMEILIPQIYSKRILTKISGKEPELFKNFRELRSLKF